MRTLPPEELARILDGSGLWRFRVETRAPGAAEWIDLSATLGGDWVVGVRTEGETPDAPVTRFTVRLVRTAAEGSTAPGISASPLNRDGEIFRPVSYPGREVRVWAQCTAPGLEPTISSLEVVGDDLLAHLAGLDAPPPAPWRLWLVGEAEDVDWATDEVVLACTTPDGRIEDASIEEEEERGAEDPGTPLAAEIQGLLDRWKPGVTLRTVGDPELGVGPYTPALGSLGAQNRAHAQRIAWDVRYLWDDAAQDYLYTLYLPPRGSATPVLTLAPDKTYEVEGQRTSRDYVRNAFALRYRDATGEIRTATRENAASIAEFGRRWMLLDETGDGSAIENAAQADALLAFADSDLSQPLTTTRRRIPFCPWLALHDVVQLDADGRTYDFPGLWAVVGLSHEVDATGGVSTVVELRAGSPVGMYYGWFARELPGVEVEPGPVLSWAPIEADDPGKAGVRITVTTPPDAETGAPGEGAAIFWRSYAEDAPLPAEWTRDPESGHAPTPHSVDLAFLVPGAGHPALILEVWAEDASGREGAPLALRLDDKWQTLSPEPRVAPRYEQEGTTGIATVRVHDARMRVVEIVFQTKEGAGAWSAEAASTDPANVGVPGADRELVRRQTVPLHSLHNSEIRGEVRYRDAGGVVRAIPFAHTFDLDTEPDVDPPTVQVDADDKLLVSVSGDEDCERILVGVDAEPTLAANHGVVEGQGGHVATGVACAPGETVTVYARGWNTSFGLGESKGVRYTNRGSQKDASGRVVLDWLNGLIEVSDSQPRTRVRLGKLGPELADYGIEVYSQTGALILGANGLGESVVDGVHIKDGAITARHVTADTIEARHIKADQVVARHIQADQIVARHIAAEQIEAEHISALAIAAGHIQADAIETQHLKAGAIDAARIRADAVEASHIKAGEINAGHISADSIRATHIQSDSILSRHIAAGQVDATKISANTLSSIVADLGEVTAGTVRDAESRVVLDLSGALLSVSDAQTTPRTRVRLGKLGAGAQDYGLEIFDAAGKLVLGASGLGTSVVGRDQITNGEVLAAKLTDDSKGYILSSVFSASSATVVAWSAGTMRFADGTSKAINAGGTGAMTAGLLYYVYYDGTATLKATTSQAAATGAGKVLVCVAKAAAAGQGQAFFVPGGRGELSLNAAQINVLSLSAISADIGDVAAGQVRNPANTAGVLLSGARPAGWQNFVDLSATGENPFLQHAALSLNADGSGTLADALLMLSFFSL